MMYMHKMEKWLFHSSNFVSFMKLNFAFCRIHGLFPYSIVENTIIYSKLNYFYSSAVTIVILLLEFVALYQMNVYENLNIPDMLQRNCFLLFGGFIMIFTYVFSIPRMYFLQKINAVSSNIPPKSFDKLAKFISVKDFFGYILIFCQTLYVLSDEIESIADLIYLHIALVVFLADMQYVNCVYIIEICFEKINKTINNLKYTMITEKPHLLRRIYHEQHNALLLIQLQNLQRQHHEISDALKLLNSTYGLHIVATVTMIFTEMTFNLYFYILKLFSSDKIFEINFYLTMLYYVLKLTLIVGVCEKAKVQAQKIGNTVHDVLLFTHDVKIKEEVIK